MGPKKLPEVDDIKKLLDFLAEEVSAVRLQQKGILTLVEEVKALRIQNEEKDKKIAFLENRVADLEQYTRLNDIIITGLDIKPRSYARAVAATNGEESGDLDVSSTEQWVAAFLQTRGIELDCGNIEACHTLPRRNVKEVCKQKTQDCTAETGEETKRDKHFHQRAPDQTQRRYRQTSMLPEETEKNSTYLDYKLQDIH